MGDRDHYRKGGRPRVAVRCLGPGREHTFLSRDPATERVCPKCRAKIDGPLYTAMRLAAPRTKTEE